MKILKYSILGIALIGASIFCSFMYYPQYVRIVFERPDMAFVVLNDIRKKSFNFSCKSGVKKAIVEAGLNPTGRGVSTLNGPRIVRTHIGAGHMLIVS